ncbi:UNVERIFIED_CONTAM: hypothetical protein FKN15_040252 [Acipenser sinensis]
MNRNALAELLEALDSRQDAEERREEHYTVLIEQDTVGSHPLEQPSPSSLSSATTISPGTQTSETADPNGPPCLLFMETKVSPQLW